MSHTCCSICVLLLRQKSRQEVILGLDRDLTTSVVLGVASTREGFRDFSSLQAAAGSGTWHMAPGSQHRFWARAIVFFIGRISIVRVSTPPHVLLFSPTMHLPVHHSCTSSEPISLCRTSTVLVRCAYRPEPHQWLSLISQTLCKPRKPNQDCRISRSHMTTL